MENNPKKSKAFIVAFILILLLLLAGYYLFKNRDTIFDAKGSTTTSKIFAPLLGTSKGKDLTVIDTGTGNKTAIDEDNITGIIITDQLGNKIVRAQAGENLKKGDVLYISGFNINKDPIVMKALASDKAKSLVFGVAGEDIIKGEMGNIIIEGILTGIPTNRVEKTPWMINNTLYLSDKIYGGMTKNPPLAPSFVVNVGSVIKVDPVNGSIRIGGATNINTNLVNNSNSKTRNYFSSIFGNNKNNPNTNNGGRSFVLNPINIPGNENRNDNYPVVTVTAESTDILFGKSTEIRWTSKNTKSCNAGKGNGTGITGSFNTGVLTATKSFSVVCTGPNGTHGGNIVINVTDVIKKCRDGADNPPLCTTKNGICINKATNAPECTILDNKCVNRADNPNLCTTKDNVCINGSINPPSCNIAEKKFPVVTVTATPNKIDAGKTTTITWTSINTDKDGCSAGEGNGVGVNGSFTTPILKASRSFAVYCTGPNGRASNTAFVTVTEVPPTVEEPGTPKPQCSNGIDDDKDNKTDKEDPNCHTDGAKEGEYIPTHDSESTSPKKPDTTVTENSCLLIEQNPLTFTEEEKARLDVLLRKFYLVSSTLKTTEDITTINNEIAQNQNFISQIQGLTKQCYEQITPSMIMIKTNNWVRHGNPWYQKIAGKVPAGTYPYTDQMTGYLDYSQLEEFGTPSGFKVISGYYYGTLTKDAVIVHEVSNTVNFLGEIGSIATFGIANEAIDKVTGDKYTILGVAGESCDKFNKFTGYGKSAQINGNNPNIYKGTYWGEGSKSWEANGGGFPGDSLVPYNGKLDTRFPQKEILEAGCNWKDGVDLDNTERILNIW